MKSLAFATEGFGVEKGSTAEEAGGEKSVIQACTSATWLKQALKLCVLVACMTAVIFQLSECILKLSYPPLSTRTELKINSTLSYPALTICRNPPYKANVLKDYGLASEITHTSEWAKFPFNETTLAEFWQKATYSESENFVIYGLGSSPSHVEMKSTFYFENGLCHSLIPIISTKEVGSSSGWSIVLKHAVTTKPDPRTPWKVFVHQVNDAFTENTLQNFGSQELIILPIGEQLNVKLTVQQLERKDHPKSECNPDWQYSATNCVERCRWQEIADKAGCSVPWMPGVGYPECNNYTAMRTVMVEYRKNTVSEQCSEQCGKPCHITQYSAFLVNRETIATSSAPRYYSQMYVFHTSKMITSVKEHADYDLSRFVADAGGSLGFLLGVSVLSLLSMLGKVLQIFTCCAKKSTDGGSVSTSRSSSINSAVNIIKR
ncbi:acid-sensing ion channel 2-like [Neocloeon triangulifer]|uniref:acid-sensing ion channel 2-like n=1 Tax=Neocloeon triangulifer TaxID=2078957 RepID=UPI00286F68B5|nr:acid-sensing ion channel 2-like [Neocloeon triangulifer]